MDFAVREHKISQHNFCDAHRPNMSESMVTPVGYTFTAASIATGEFCTTKSLYSSTYPTSHLSSVHRKVHQLLSVNKRCPSKLHCKRRCMQQLALTATTQGKGTRDVHS